MGANVYYDTKYKRWYIKNYCHGCNHTILFDENKNYFKTKKSALDYIYRNKDFLNYGDKQNSSNKNIFNNFLDELKIRVKDSTFNSYYSKFVNYTMLFFDNKKINKFSNKDLIAISTRINNLNLSKRSISKILYVTREFVHYLNNNHIVKLNASMITINKNIFEERKIMNYYSLDDFEKFISCAESNREILIFKLLFYYGLRIGELRGLMYKDIDFNNDIVYIRRSINCKNIDHITKINSLKTNSSNRYYPLLPDVKKLLINLRRSNDINEFVFSNAKNKKDLTNVKCLIGESSIRRMNETIANKAHLHHIRLHDFRHSCAIFLVQNGFEITRISNWLGHASPSITADFYLRYKDRNKNEIGDYISNKVKLNE